MAKNLGVPTRVWWLPSGETPELESTVERGAGSYEERLELFHIDSVKLFIAGATPLPRDCPEPTEDWAFAVSAILSIDGVRHDGPAWCKKDGTEVRWLDGLEVRRDSRRA